MSRGSALVLAVALVVASGACESQAAQSQVSAPIHRANVSLRINGMACDSCAARVAKELREVDGVLEVEVLFAQSRAAIDYDAKRVTPQRLIDVVSDLGFEATLDE